MSFSSSTLGVRRLLEAGVHFGHQTKRWNPAMKPYLFGKRDKIHIIDLDKTLPLLQAALQVIEDAIASGGRLLFVGTKHQAQEAIKQAAELCGQYYVNHRWLGGMLTNWNTVSNSIKHLKSLEAKLQSDEIHAYTKKEQLNINREVTKLRRCLGGISEMGGTPDLLVVIDTNHEKTAVMEAVKLGIPVVAILDSNSDPRGIAYPVPGNDDAIRAIQLYCEVFSQAALRGLQKQMHTMGLDMGEASDAPPVAEDDTWPEAGDKPQQKDENDENSGVTPGVVSRMDADVRTEIALDKDHRHEHKLDHEHKQDHGNKHVYGDKHEPTAQDSAVAAVAGPTDDTTTDAEQL